MTQPPQQQPPQFSPQTQQAIAKISLRIDDLTQTVFFALNSIIAEKDQQIRELEAKLTELQVPIKPTVTE